MDKDIFQYKTEAHELIEDLILMGMKRGRIYKKLLIKLGLRKGEEHIGGMSTIAQVKRAISVLEVMKGLAKEITGDLSPAQKLELLTRQIKNQEKKRRQVIKSIKQMESKKERIEKGLIMDLKGKKNRADNMDELQRLANTLNV